VSFLFLYIFVGGSQPISAQKVRAFVYEIADLSPAEHAQRDELHDLARRPQSNVSILDSGRLQDADLAATILVAEGLSDKGAACR
jgi:hypothetical protein